MRIESERYFRYFTYIKPIARLPIVKTYGTAIFTLVTMAIFIIFAIKPTVETIVILQKKLENANQVLDKLKQKANTLTLGKQNYQNLDPQVKNKIQTSIPDIVELKSLIQTLEFTARKNQASISALQIQPLILETKSGESVGGLAELSFTFNLAGIYKNLTSLLQDLKTSARLISIESVSLNKVSEEDENLVISISGKAYFIK